MATTPRMSGASIAQVVVVVVVIVSIQLALPPSVTIGPIWMVPLLELTGIPIALAIRRVEDHEGRILRRTMDAYLMALYDNEYISYENLITHAQDPEAIVQKLQVAGANKRK